MAQRKSGKIEQHGVKSMLAFVVGRLRGREDREHEMVVNRLVISFLLMVYLAIAGIMHTMEVFDPVVANAVYGCFSVAFFIHMAIWPGTSHPRRIVAMFVDLGALTYCLYVGGSTTAVLFPIYLWIIFGNGFRFGLRYLFSAMTLAIAGFTYLLLYSDFWRSTELLGAGLLAGLLVLPAYTSTLIRSLNSARQQAEEANKTKSVFLASVSHELRTPLNAVIGMGDLLRDTRLDAEQKEMLGTISTSARSLLSLIEDVLDFSRIEAGRMHLPVEEFDLHQALAEVKGMVEALARAKGLRFGLHIDPAMPFQLIGDRRHLEEVLINLCGNAVKFTEAGCVTISAELVSSSDSRARLRFEVADTGIGIAPEATTRIFESFTQADETILNRFGGTGLGLALCKRLAEALGGSIGVESEPGKGSTFWVELEFGVVPASGLARTSGLRCVVVTEDRALAPHVEDGLRPLGVPVEFTYDPSAAERAVQESGGRGERMLCIIDAELPHASLLAQEIRAAAPLTVALVLVQAAGVDEPLTAEARTLYLAALSRAPSAMHIAAVANMALGQSARSAEPDAGVPPTTGRSLSILIADDNVTNQKVLAKILERGGHRPSVVNNGEEAVDAMLAETFDIVFMDVNMPVMSGIEATKLYRFAALGRARVPIVALTADATPEAREACLASGMDDCATKPIEAGKLFRMIDRLVPVAEDTQPVLAPAREGESELVADISAHPRFKAETRALDQATLDRLLDLGGEAFLTDLAAEFLIEGERILEEIAESVAKDDSEMFRDRVHALRSGAANLGALSLYELSLSMRSASQAELAEKGADHVASLQREFDRVRSELEARSADKLAEVIRPLRARAQPIAGSERSSA